MGGMKYIQQTVLAWLIIGGFFALTGWMIYIAKDGTPLADSTGAVFMLLGTAASAFGAVIQFFFGSTKGSAEKTEALLNIARGPQGGTDGKPCEPAAQP